MKRSVVLGIALLFAACGQTDLAPGGSTDAVPVESASPAQGASAAPAGPRACAPVCSTGASDPGLIPAGEFTTQNFLDGFLTVTFPGTWESHEDQGVEFSAFPEGKQDEQDVFFWLDIEPVRAGERVAGVPITVEGWSEWLTSNPDLTVTRAGSGRIGTIRATAFDIAVADTADVKPACDGHKCMDVLTWPGSDHYFGIGDSFFDPIRLFLADVEYDGASHLLAVAVHAPFWIREFLPVAKELIATARLEGVTPVSPI